MKIIDRFVLKSFVRPFIITFLVMVLFLLMQFVWKYIDDLVGRGVEWYYIAELLFYTSATVVPMALPLAVLLSSIMVLGTMGENNELAALKSAGHSLIRVMRPLIIFMVFLSVGAFLFSNYVIPVANFKSKTLLNNIRNAKPALSIMPGVFYNGLEGYSLKVSDKYGPNQSLLRDVLIYDHKAKAGNKKVVVADSGKMEVTEDEMYLLITLYKGNVYEDQIPKRREDRDNHPFVKTAFTENLIRFNLAEFQTGDLHQSGQKDFEMLNISQLHEAVDSIHRHQAERKQKFEEEMVKRYSHQGKSKNRKTEATENPAKGSKDSSAWPKANRGVQEERIDTPSSEKAGDTAREEAKFLAQMNDTLLHNFDPESRKRIIQNSLRIARSSQAYYTNAAREYDWRNRNLVRHILEWQKKFSVSFSVIVLFFIGAPLGAIIRKGGMGMPVVVSVIIFIVYHVTTFSFEKLGRHMVWDPFPAMWTSNFMLLPIGIWLTYKSATDSVIFNIELYLKPFQKISGIFAKLTKRTKSESASAK